MHYSTDRTFLRPSRHPIKSLKGWFRNNENVLQAMYGSMEWNASKLITERVGFEPTRV